MSALLERWAKQAVMLEKKGNILEPAAPLWALRDFDTLRDVNQALWRRRMRDIRDSGAPMMMPEGTFGGLIAYPPAQTITTTSINGTVNLWDNLTYTPIPKNSVLAPQVYRIALPIKLTTGVTPGNITWVPAINSTGTWTTGGTAVAGGSALGSTAAIALTASITNAFAYLIGDLTIRNAGTASVIVAMFHAVSTQNTAAGVAGPAATSAAFNLLFGGTAVTVDTQTSGQSIQIGATHTTTVVTHNFEQIHWMDWN